MAAAVAALGGGWLACWWLPLPSSFVAYVHYYTAGSGSFVATGPPTILGLAAVVAFVVGTAGYLLGVAGRRWYWRSGFGGVREIAGD